MNQNDHEGPRVPRFFTTLPYTQDEVRDAGNHSVPLTTFDVSEFEPAMGGADMEEYLGNAVIADFSRLTSEGDWIALSASVLDIDKETGEPSIAMQTLLIERMAGQFTGHFVKLAFPEDEGAQDNPGDISFLIEPKVTAMDPDFGVCEGVVGELPRVRRGGYLMMGAYFADIDHEDPAFRFGPVEQAISVYNSPVAQA